MLDHMILTVSDIKRSLAFYEAALKPLHKSYFKTSDRMGSSPI
jgi:catechol 2,3-dioxygenase-like lactoylglutathione lyase family enzyme